MTDRTRLDGRVAVITGAGGGVGREAAIVMASRGAAIAAVDLDVARLEGLGERLPAGARWAALKGDVTNEASIADCLTRARGTFGRIDILLNAAAIEVGETAIGQTAAADFQRVFAVMASGVFLAMKHVIPMLVEGGGGAIVNRSGPAAWRPLAGQAARAAAEAAVVGMTRTAALEWGDAGIRVNCINLGPEADARGAALLAAFLACDEAGFITGAAHPIGEEWRA